LLSLWISFLCFFRINSGFVLLMVAARRLGWQGVHSWPWGQEARGTDSFFWYCVYTSIIYEKVLPGHN
jgi:hypothetical protein